MSEEQQIRALCMGVFDPGGIMSGEEQIRALCMSVVAAEHSEQFSAAITALKIALRNHIVTIHNLAVKMALENGLENGLKNREVAIGLRPITQKQFEIAAQQVRERAAAKAAA